VVAVAVHFQMVQPTLLPQVQMEVVREVMRQVSPKISQEKVQLQIQDLVVAAELRLDPE
jgi:hypothetical protein